LWELSSVVSGNVELNSDNMKTSSVEENKVLHAPSPQICYNDTIIFLTPSVTDNNMPLNDYNQSTVIKK